MTKKLTHGSSAAGVLQNQLQKSENEKKTYVTYLSLPLSIFKTWPKGKWQHFCQPGSPLSAADFSLLTLPETKCLEHS